MLGFFVLIYNDYLEKKKNDSIIEENSSNDSNLNNTE